MSYSFPAYAQSLTDGDVLQWNDSAQKFLNVTSAGLGLPTSGNSGDLLVFNGSTWNSTAQSAILPTVSGTTRKIDVTGAGTPTNYTVTLPDVVHVGPTDNYASTGTDSALLILGDCTITGPQDHQQCLFVGPNNIAQFAAKCLVTGNSNALNAYSEDSLVSGRLNVSSSNLINGSAIIGLSNTSTSAMNRSQVIGANNTLTGGSTEDTLVLGTDNTCISTATNSFQLLGHDVVVDDIGTDQTTVVSGGNDAHPSASSYYNASYAGRTYVNSASGEGLHLVGRPAVYIASSGTVFRDSRPTCSELSFPTASGDDLASKTYVDNQISGISFGWASYTPSLFNVTNTSSRTLQWARYRSDGSFVEVVVAFDVSRSISSQRFQITITIPTGAISTPTSPVYCQGSVTEVGTSGVTQGWVGTNGTTGAVVATGEAITGTVSISRCIAVFFYLM